MNIEGRIAYEKRIQENADPYCIAYIERQTRLGEQDCPRADGPGPNVAMRDVAELERLWGRVAMAIAGCERELENMADTNLDLTCEMKEILRQVAAALKPHALKAMQLRTTHGEHYCKLFVQHERARS